MALTNTSAKNAKSKDKAYKLYDSEGLFLFVPTSGKKVWRFKYRFNKKEKLLVIGKYPSISLKGARTKRDEYHSLLSEGLDPSQVRQTIKKPEGKTFKEVALEWIAFKAMPNTKRCWKQSHSKAVLRSLDNEVFPAESMKMDIAQTIPLSSQALRILTEVKSITGQGKYVFASLTGTGKPISENGMLFITYWLEEKG